MVPNMWLHPLLNHGLWGVVWHEWGMGLWLYYIVGYILVVGYIFPYIPIMSPRKPITPPLWFLEYSHITSMIRYHIIPTANGWIILNHGTSCWIMLNYVHHVNHVKTCSVQPWRCSAPKLRKGCVFLKCHVGGLSICRCICDPWSSSSSSSSPSSSSSSSSSSLMKICWCYYQIQHVCQRGWWIPYKDKLISFLMQHICQRGWWICWPLTKISWCDSSFNIFVGGVVDFWRLMKISWCYSLFSIVVSGGGGCWSLMQISWCDYTIQHICQRGWWMCDPLWRQLDVITPFNIFARGGGCLIPYEDKLMWLHKSTYLS